MRRVIGVLIVLAIVALAALPLVAQGKTGTQFYNEYRAAFAKAQKMADVLPWMSKAQADRFAKIPEADRAMMWEMSKQMQPSGVKVVKETATADGATLELAGVDPQKKPVKGTVTLVKEGGAWKIGQETWEM